MSEGVSIDVWSAELDGAPPRLLKALSADERRRAARIVDETARTRWSAARAILKTLLGERLNVDPASLTLVAGAHGKPMLAGWETDVRFSLAHSSRRALYAFASECDVGVDLELLSGRGSRLRRHEIGIAKRFFGEREAVRLDSLAEEQREREFLKAWVRHEAAVKCLGLGLGVALDRAMSLQGLQLTEIDVGPDAVAALALHGTLGELRHNAFTVEPCSTSGLRSPTR